MGDVFDPSILRTTKGMLGGTFFGQGGQGRDRDRKSIEGWGFTIIQEKTRAGRADFVVYGDAYLAEFISLNRYDIQCTIPFMLYFLPVGEILNVELIIGSSMGFSEF